MFNEVKNVSRLVMQTFEKPQIKHPQNRTFCQSMKIGYSTKSKWVHSSKVIKLTVFFSDQSIYVYFSIFYSPSMFHKMLLYLSRINFFIKFKLHVHDICGNPLIYIFFTNLMIIKICQMTAFYSHKRIYHWFGFVNTFPPQKGQPVLKKNIFLLIFVGMDKGETRI